MPRLLWLHRVHISHISLPKAQCGEHELIPVQGGLGLKLFPTLTSHVTLEK